MTERERERERERKRECTRHRTLTFMLIHVTIKLKFPVTGPLWPRVWVEVYLYSSMTVALEGGEWSVASPARPLPQGKTRYPFYRRLGGPQGRSGRAENLVPTGIRSLAVQPVVSRYTDWVTWPTLRNSRSTQIKTYVTPVEPRT